MTTSTLANVSYALRIAGDTFHADMADGLEDDRRYGRPSRVPAVKAVALALADAAKGTALDPADRDPAARCARRLALAAQTANGPSVSLA